MNHSIFLFFSLFHQRHPFPSTYFHFVLMKFDSAITISQGDGHPPVQSANVL